MPCSEETPAISPTRGLGLWGERTWLHFLPLSTGPCLTEGSEQTASYDLHSAHDYTVQLGENPGETYVQKALPSGCYGRAAPHSGLAAKHFIDIGAVVIGDEDYRGNIGAVMFSLGEEKTAVQKGDHCHPAPCSRPVQPSQL
ncbi:deoxyuridine 5'-triphosphate nucleotidohydrolase-like [Myotis yumanensis]|uniref:deoxyuridine 5'-triphosphate nucleotidohydrolase-like n=1 Tax=Myotis yumanensis TaxID=159337 RepID=UPI0038D15DEC